MWENIKQIKLMNIKILEKINYGLYIVSSKKGNLINGQITDAVFQITVIPPKIAISINNLCLTHDYIVESQFFCITILPSDFPLKLIGQFGFKSERDIDIFENIPYELTENGLPYLKNSLGYIECKVTSVVSEDMHTVFMGEVTDCDFLKAGEPMTYAYFQSIKGGINLPNAPHYIDEEEKNPKRKYRCTVCNYQYDPEKGDPDGGIKPGTAFEDLPFNWECPMCGIDKSLFEKED